MAPKQARHLAAELQAATDEMFADVSDVPNFRLEAGIIRYGITMWNPALQRQRIDAEFEPERVIYELRQASPSTCLALQRAIREEEWGQAAALLTTQAFGKALVSQWQRAYSARALGIIRPGGIEPLGIHRMLIDREPLAMLRERRVDLHRISPGDLKVGGFAIEHVLFDLEALRFTVVHPGDGPPLVWTALDLGTSRYDGVNLVLEGALPETALVTAVGRRLGNVVEMNRPSLARRRIRAAALLEKSGANGARVPDRTWLKLEMELVEVG